MASWRAMPRPVRAYELKVTLQRVRPPVWRRIKVRSDVTLEDFHRVLQVAMGWSDSHMHAFRPAGGQGKGRGGGPPVERDQKRRTRLDDLLRKPRDRMVYEYDFGDGWEHEVLLERVGDHPAGARYPWVLAGARACPPEDVGGVGGYARFLQAMRDSRHPDHEEMMEWHGGPFDPAAFDVQAVNRAFHGGWAPAKLDG
jgi:Plasmid pRiA4b ORF-3-like protein